VLNKNVPEIRFPGYTGDWEQQKVYKLCTISTGKGNTQDKVEDGKYPFYVRSATIERSNDFLYDQEAVLTVGDGVGTGKVFHYVNGKYNLHQRVYRMYDFINIIIPKYFYYFFSKNFYRRVMAMTAKTSVDSVRMEMIANMDVYLPKVHEQKEIVNLIEELDKTIALLQQQLTTLKQTKQGFLQKMFPKEGESVPDVRFPGFNKDWEWNELKNLAEFNPKCILPDKFNYVDLESVKGTKLLGYRIEQFNTAPSRAQRLARKGDVFYQTVRPNQRNNYLFNLNDDNYVFSTGYAQMRPHVDSYFLLSILQKESFVNKVLDKCTGTSYPAINSKQLAEIQVSIPSSVLEQSKIGSFFKSLDDSITLKEQELQALQQTKKAFLQKMFV